MNVHFNLTHAFVPGSSALENAKVLKHLMACLVTIDEIYLEHHQAPKLYASHVVYGRTNEWEPIGAVLERRSGDCKSLAAWRVAELRKEGKRADIVFRWKERPNSMVRDYHLLVVTPEGYEDPSKKLGMGQNEVAPMPGRIWHR